MVSGCCEADCTQYAIYASKSDHWFCLGHAIAHLRNHADGLEATLAESPDWETETDGCPDDGLGRTVADRMRTEIAEMRGAADRLLEKRTPSDAVAPPGHTEIDRDHKEQP